MKITIEYNPSFTDLYNEIEKRMKSASEELYEIGLDHGGMKPDEYEKTRDDLHDTIRCYRQALMCLMGVPRYMR